LLRELSILREEAIPWVNGIYVGDFGCGDNPIRSQVTIRTPGASDADGLVSELDVKGLNIGLGVNGEGFNAELTARADNAEGDFTAICDEDFLDHQERWIIINR
jgi:hypothetical protein